MTSTFDRKFRETGQALGKNGYDVRPYLSPCGPTYFWITAPMAKPPLALWTATEVKGPGTKN